MSLDQSLLTDMVVEVVTLDSVVEALDVKETTNIMLKIDVEDFRLYVVEGVVRTFKKFRPYYSRFTVLMS